MKDNEKTYEPGYYFLNHPKMPKELGDMVMKGVIAEATDGFTFVVMNGNDVDYVRPEAFTAEVTITPVTVVITADIETLVMKEDNIKDSGSQSKPAPQIIAPEGIEGAEKFGVLGSKGEGV